MSHTHPTIIFKIQLEVTSLISTDVGEEKDEELPREVCPVQVYLQGVSSTRRDREPRLQGGGREPFTQLSWAS